MGVISTTMKLRIQFVAAPMAAPLVRMVRELISVGYTIQDVSDWYKTGTKEMGLHHGTPCMPIPKKT